MTDDQLSLWWTLVAVAVAVPVGALAGLVIAAKVYDFDEDYNRVRRRRRRDMELVGSNGVVIKFWDKDMNQVPIPKGMK